MNTMSRPTSSARRCRPTRRRTSWLGTSLSSCRAAISAASRCSPTTADSRRPGCGPRWTCPNRAHTCSWAMTKSVSSLPPSPLGHRLWRRRLRPHVSQLPLRQGEWFFDPATPAELASIRRARKCGALASLPAVGAGVVRPGVGSPGGGPALCHRESCRQPSRPPQARPAYRGTALCATASSVRVGALSVGPGRSGADGAPKDCCVRTAALFGRSGRYTLRVSRWAGTRIIGIARVGRYKECSVGMNWSPEYRCDTLVICRANRIHRRTVT